MSWPRRLGTLRTRVTCAPRERRYVAASAHCPTEVGRGNRGLEEGAPFFHSTPPWTPPRLRTTSSSSSRWRRPSDAPVWTLSLLRFKGISAEDKKTELHTLSFRAPKIRCLRSLNISGGKMMQVLDFAIFPEPEFDLPIFCANFFTGPTMSVVILDLNPLHNVITQHDYKDKYYKELLPLGTRYAKILPWGGKITSESVMLFSPIVIWSKFTPSQSMHEILYSAFMDYFKAWFELMERSSEEKNSQQILLNREAQHRYLTWRAEKDPGFPMLKKLLGETSAKDLVDNFLFYGVNFLGTKTFLDYFPEYGRQDGTISQRRSILGKSFQTRPWDEHGNFV